MEHIPAPSSPAPSLPPDIVDRLRFGDERAMELVFRAYYAALCAFATRLLNDAARAEEVVQDTFDAVWTARRELRINTSLRAYLFTTVRHRAFNVRKHERVADRWRRSEAGDDVRELHPRPPAADEALERAELRQRLAAALAALPERCALVMHLRWRDGLRHAEIAETLGISTKAVEQQLARGLRLLRERLL